MQILRPVAPWMFMSVLALLSLCSGARDRSRSRGVTRAPRSGTGPNRGRFNLKDGMQCTWATRDVNEEVKMSVTCENPQAGAHGGITDVQCEYRAKPHICPGYESNVRGFYKQVSRALKKLQGKICRDERALVKAGMCKRAPRDAHFKLGLQTSVPAASTTTATTTTTTRNADPRGTPADCRGRADHRQVAQEYCSSSWASVCAFFFSMLQSDEC